MKTRSFLYNDSKTILRFGGIKMNQVRYAIIGIGNMGMPEAKMLFAGEIKGGTLSAVCDINPVKLEVAKEYFGDMIKYYSSVEDLLADEDVCDAIHIATPHYDHPTIAIQGFKHNLHVLIEKPAGVYTKAVRVMNEAYEASKENGKLFGIMYNQRTNPTYQKVKDIIEKGELGEIRRINWIITSWYRPQSYYDSGTWRATWAGEGGGVLLNQDPHQLDLWQWVTGMMPTRVRAFAAYGKMHDIEVEDDVTAYAEYANGATAVFVTSTSDAPGTNRLEISGDMGKIVIEHNQITFYRNRISEREFNRTFTGGFGNPECWECKIPVKGECGEHKGIFQNYTDAILKGTPLLAPGVEGIKGLTISNAIHLSSWLDDWVTLPLDEELFYEKLQEKIRDSKFVKKEVEENKILDVSNTH